MAERLMRKETAIVFVGGSEALEVRETPEDLIIRSKDWSSALERRLV
jgi:hypothetical protein